jgi:peptidoglycan hydrolase CwlO-like protein
LPNASDINKIKALPENTSRKSPVFTPVFILFSITKFGICTISSEIKNLLFIFADSLNNIQLKNKNYSGIKFAVSAIESQVKRFHKDIPDTQANSSRRENLCNQQKRFYGQFSL